MIFLSFTGLAIAGQNLSHLGSNLLLKTVFEVTNIYPGKERERFLREFQAGEKEKIHRTRSRREGQKKKSESILILQVHVQLQQLGREGSRRQK